MILTIVTGSEHKLRELQRLFPAGYELVAHPVDLPEIQSLDPVEIVTDKVKRAYEIAKRPVVVDDVSIGLDDLQGLPGPFIKFFEQRLGPGAMYQLAGNAEAPATVTGVVAFYDGEKLLVGRGEVHGKVVSPRGDAGFGFDVVFMPSGHNQTFAQMTSDQKDGCSHRGMAVRNLLKQIRENTALDL